MDSEVRDIRPEKISVFDCWIGAQVLFLAAALAFMKRTRSLPALIEAFSPRPAKTVAPVAVVGRIVWLTQAILWRIYARDFCMQRSFVLLYLLRRRGLPVNIHFGVTRREEDLRGHAWLEIDGKPISEAKDPRGVYTTVCSFPSSLQP